MAVTAKVFNAAITALANKEIDWGSDTIKVTLHTSAYTPNQATHDYQNDLTNEVANGNGYTTGGATLVSKTEAFTGQVKKFDAADVTWAASTITARYAVVADTTPGTAATNPLICYVDFGADVTSSGGDFTITWDADGIFTVTVA
jgi:hypothetical protein